MSETIKPSDIMLTDLNRRYSKVFEDSRNFNENKNRRKYYPYPSMPCIQEMWASPQGGNFIGIGKLKNEGHLTNNNLVLVLMDVLEAKGFEGKGINEICALMEPKYARQLADWIYKQVGKDDL